MKRIKEVLILLISLGLCSCETPTSNEEPINDTVTIEEPNKEEDKQEQEEGSEEKQEDKQEDKQEENEEPIITYTSREAEIYNATNGNYHFSNPTLTIYKVSNSEIPHVDLLDFVHDLDGYFDYENISYSYNEETKAIRLLYKGSHDITFDTKNDLIEIDSWYIFLEYATEGEAFDYREYLSENLDYCVNDSLLVYDLGKYGFNIIYQDGKCFIPLFIVNLLFCSFNCLNLFYNNDICYATFSETTEIDGYFSCDDNGTNQTTKFREETMNSLYFLFDYYYGLNKYKGFNNGIKEHISSLDNGSILNKFLSQNPRDNLEALNYFVYQDLDELHTRVDIPSFYFDDSNPLTAGIGEFYTNYYRRRSQQYIYRNEKGLYGQSLRFYKDLAVISFDSFLIGTIDQTKNKDGSIKFDAWNYDSFYFMKEMMANIKQYPEVTDIIIDLSTNGGGNLAALEKVMGFLTDKPVKFSICDSLDQSSTVWNFEVDVDNDGIYDNDAYENYNWHLLTGINTFSAANLMVGLFRQMKLGDVIGQKSGGGMCAVLPTVLADGTGIAISSPYCLQYLEIDNDGKYEFSDIEGGFEPDIKVPYDFFYNDQYLYSVINDK